MGEQSLQLSTTLKLKIVDAHKEGEGYKNFCVRNRIKKWQSMRRVEVKARSGRQRKISDIASDRIVRNGK